MIDNFYRSFEEKHRGSRQLILQRLRVYLPFIQHFRNVNTNAKALDLGCGRGEWLEILKEIGFQGRGVDLDEGMLEACRELHLEVSRADLMETLQLLPDTSLQLLTAFHVIEHVAFSDLRLLVSEAHRILVPGGLLILETPNCENLGVSSISFWLDPTHQRPIPPQLLSFLPQYYNFDRTKLLRLQEPQRELSTAAASIRDLFSLISPDLAIVAQKGGPKALTSYADPGFSQNYGISMESVLGNLASSAVTQQRAIDDLRDANANLLAELQSLQARTTQDELLAARSQLHDLVGWSDELQKKVKSESERAERSEIWARELQNKLVASNENEQRRAAEVNQLREMKCAIEKEVSEYKATNLVQATTMEVLEADLRNKEETAARMKAAVAVADTNLGDANLLLAEAEKEIDDLNVRHAALEVEHQKQAMATIHYAQSYELLQAKYGSIISSTSWRILGPLRAAKELLHGRRQLAIDHLYPRRSVTDGVQPDVQSADVKAGLPPPSDAPPLPAVVRRVLQDLKDWNDAHQVNVLEPSDSARDPTDLSIEHDVDLPTLVIVSPLPPERTGIADYTAVLIPELSKFYRIELVVVQEVVADAVSANRRIHTPQWLRKNYKQSFRVLYHIGNSHFHQHMLELLQDIPGVVVLHDFFLGHLLAYLELNYIRPGIWERALHRSHGYKLVKERHETKDLGKLILDYPANAELIEDAQGIVVHSEYSRELADLWYGAGTASSWAVIPLVRQASQVGAREQSRAVVGLKTDDFVVCAFGESVPSKFNHRLIDAWVHSKLASNPKNILIFVGKRPSGEYEETLNKLLKAQSVTGRVIFSGWTEPGTYACFLNSADVAVQLRSDSRGESSAAVLDCMNFGIPTIVNANGSMAELSSDSVLMLSDEFEREDLVSALEELEAHPDHRRKIGQRAAIEVAAKNRPKICAEHYFKEIERFTARWMGERSAIKQLAPMVSPQRTTSGFQREALQLAMLLPARVQMKRLFLDVSATRRASLRTGIERVSRALQVAMIELPLEGFIVEPVYLSDAGGYWHYRLASHYTRDLLGCPTNVALDTVISPTSGDVLLCLDYTGDLLVHANKAGLISDLQRAGIKCYSLVHDLLPIRMPEMFPPGTAKKFGEWLQAIASMDGVVAISKHVMTHFREWVDASGCSPPAHFKLAWSYHGSDLENSAPSFGMTPDSGSILAKMGSSPSFLLVGTIEPRKGHLQVLEAFDCLWSSGVQVNLVIVGHEGWKELPNHMRRNIPNIVSRLKAHPQNGQKLFWLNGISDEYLQKVYSKATCVLMASEDEGFGLPLIEAARLNVPLLLRDISIFREIAGENASYFSAVDPGQLAVQVKQWLELFRRGLHPTPTGIILSSWVGSAKRLSEIVLFDQHWELGRRTETGEGDEDRSTGIVDDNKFLL